MDYAILGARISPQQLGFYSRAYELGVNSYLCKPVDFAGFVDVIRKVGMYWMFLNETPG